MDTKPAEEEEEELPEEEEAATTRRRTTTATTGTKSRTSTSDASNAGRRRIVLWCSSRRRGHHDASNDENSSNVRNDQNCAGIGSSPDDSSSRRRKRLLWTGRIAFVCCLAAVAGVLGGLSYHFLRASETSLAETQFESIADRALNEAVRIAHRKRHAAMTMAEMAGRMNPDPNRWPFVYIDGFEELATKLLDTVAATEETSILTFGPMVQAGNEQQSEWEDFAYNYFDNIAQFPNGTGVNADFGKGIWTVEFVDGVGVRKHETTGAAVEGLSSPVLFPAFQLRVGPSPALLFSLRYGAARAKAIDSTVECSSKWTTNSVYSSDNGSLTSDTANRASAPDDHHICGSLTDMLTIVGLETRGPAAVMYEPIFPKTMVQPMTPTQFVGIIAIPLMLDETLENVFADTVSGVDAVYHAVGTGSEDGTATAMNTYYTYTVRDGVAVPRYVNFVSLDGGSILVLHVVNGLPNVFKTHFGKIGVAGWCDSFICLKLQEETETYMIGSTITTVGVLI